MYIIDMNRKKDISDIPVVFYATENTFINLFYRRLQPSERSTRMSIAAFFTGVGTFLSGPVVTGIANVASIVDVGVGIATKVDTHEMKSDIRSMKSEIQTLGTDICALTADVADFRKENMWNIQNMGANPVRVNGSTVQYVQLQNPQAQVSPVVSQPQAQQVAPVVSQPQTPPVQAPSFDMQDLVTAMTNAITPSLTKAVADGFAAANASVPVAGDGK